MKKLSITLFSLVLLVAQSAFAQEEVAEAAETKGDLTISGYVDTYYFANFNKPKSNTNQGRIFDIPSGQFNLGLVQTMIQYETGKSKVVVDLTYGPNAELGNFGNTGSAILIKQAYLSYNLTEKLTFTVGQYGTHIGYELIDAPANYNYSLSYLFGNGPFYHTGAKLDLAVSEKFALMVGVVNGWDSQSDYNDKKSVTAQVFIAPTDGWNVYLNWIGGDEYAGASAFGDTPGSFASLFDLTTTYAVSDKFNLGVNAAYGSFKAGDDAEIVEEGSPWAKDATWYGAALYMNYQISESFGLGFRGEHFNDKDGVRYFGPIKVNAFTLTGDIKLDGGKFNIKPEFRFDKADGDFFEDSDGALSKDSQATFGAAFIYKF